MKHHSTDIGERFRARGDVLLLCFAGARIKAAEGRLFLQKSSFAALLLAGMLSLLNPAALRAQVPFQCTGDLYQVQSGQLRIFDTATSSYTNIGPANPSYNSLGYNSQDDLFYATRSNAIVRIDANGTMTQMFSIGFNSYVGDIDDANNMYLRRNANMLTRINLITQNQKDIPLSTSLAAGAADWAFVSTPSGERLIAPGRTQLSLIDPETGQNSNSTIADYPNEGSAGATWADSNGRVFTFRNTTGNVFEILDYLTPNPRAVLVAVGVPSGNNDGSSCRKRPFPNFPPLAFDDAFATPFQTTLTNENVIADNGNGMDNDPDGSEIAVTTDLIALPDHGDLSIDADGNFSYVPDPGFSGTDQFSYEISDATGLTATATVTITVTRPKISIEKGSHLHVGKAQKQFHLPGNDVVYHVTVANTGNQQVDDDSLFIVDRWPPRIYFLKDDLDSGGAPQFAATDAVVWKDDGSGLDFNYSRDVGYSNKSNPPTAFTQCDYQPSSGYDSNVRFICIRPLGGLQPSGRATFYMRGRIE